MAVSTYLDQIQQLYIAYFGRPADPIGQTYWASQVDANNGSIASVIAGFSASTESAALFGNKSTIDKVTAIYMNAFGRAPEPEGLAYWVAILESGAVSPAQASWTIQQSAGPGDASAVANKLEAAKAFTAQIDTPAEIAGYSGASAADSARAFLNAVDATPGSFILAYEGAAAALAAATGIVVTPETPVTPVTPVTPPPGPTFTVVNLTGGTPITLTSAAEKIVVGAGTSPILADQTYVDAHPGVKLGDQITPAVLAVGTEIKTPAVLYTAGDEITPAVHYTAGDEITPAVLAVGTEIKTPAVVADGSEIKTPAGLYTVGEEISPAVLYTAGDEITPAVHYTAGDEITPAVVAVGTEIKTPAVVAVGTEIKTPAVHYTVGEEITPAVVADQAYVDTHPGVKLGDEITPAIPSGSTPSTPGIITNFSLDADKLDLPQTIVLAGTYNASQTGVANLGITSINKGLVTFGDTAAATASVADKYSALLTAMGTTKSSAAFVVGSDTYIVQGDGVAGVQDSDILVQLTGVTNVTDLSAIIV